MKGLYRYLSPFSPDQSGAVAVLYELGGIIVILDAGGCAGNICGFDEPRWGHKQSAVYSAGIRDLDAILGRDERTIDKVGGAVEAVGNANFIALIGTPVPAVVGTDLRALARMCEKKFGLPTLPVETYGMEYYDKGAELSYMTLIKALEKGALDASYEKLGLHLPSRVAAAKAAALEGAAPVDPRAHVASVGVLGATPLDLLSLDGAELIRQRVETKQTQQNLLHMRLRTGEITSPFRHVVQKTYEDNKPDVYVFGMGCGFDQLGHLFTVDRNVVVSPAGLKPAKYLEQKYGIPYEVSYPIGHELAVSLHRRVCEAAQPADAEPAARSAKVLILHQQVAGNSLRESLESINDANRTLNALDAMGPTSMLEESGKGVPGTEDIPRPEPEVHPGAELSISVGTFFEQEGSIAREGDRKFTGEDEFLDYLKAEQFDVILGDPMYRMGLKWWDGTFLPLPQYSVSGEAHEALTEAELL